MLVHYFHYYYKINKIIKIIINKQISFHFKSLEETVDKWLHDLNEQEKIFLNQAAQVNMWDRQLIENGEKISETHNEVRT